MGDTYVSNGYSSLKAEHAVDSGTASSTAATAAPSAGQDSSNKFTVDALYRLPRGHLAFVTIPESDNRKYGGPLFYIPPPNYEATTPTVLHAYQIPTSGRALYSGFKIEELAQQIKMEDGEIGLNGTKVNFAGQGKLSLSCPGQEASLGEQMARGVRMNFEERINSGQIVLHFVDNPHSIPAPIKAKDKANPCAP